MSDQDQEINPKEVQSEAMALHMLRQMRDRKCATKKELQIKNYDGIISILIHIYSMVYLHRPILCHQSS